MQLNIQMLRRLALIFLYVWCIDRLHGYPVAWYHAPKENMPDLSYADLANNQSTLSPSSLLNTANAAADLVCDLYEAYPTGIIPSVGSTPISDLTDGLLRNLCGPRDKLPPPRQLPFSGGQCLCVTYRVQGTINGFNQGTQNVDAIVPGPIGNIEVRNVEGGSDKRYGFTYGGPGCTSGFYSIIQSAFEGTINITSVTPFGGGPNNCGDPKPQYPPTLPPPNNFTNNTNITVGGATVTVPVTIIPTVFAPVNVFRPELNVDVGGINVNFALDGITFSPSINPTISVRLPGNDTRPVLPPSRPGKPSGCEVDFSPLFDRFDDVDDQLDIIERCACGPDQVVRVQNYAPANSRTITLPSNTVGVRVFVTQASDKVPSQYGNGGAPDVLFVGWCSFGNGTPAGLRVPIQHAAAFFPAPERATAFSYTVVYESLARLEVIYLEDVIP